MPKKISPDRLNLVTAKSFCELLIFEVTTQIGFLASYQEASLSLHVCPSLFE